MREGNFLLLLFRKFRLNTSNQILFVLCLIFVTSCKDEGLTQEPNKKLTPSITGIEPSSGSPGEIISILGKDLWGTENCKVLFSNGWSQLKPDVEAEIIEKGDGLIKVRIPNDPLLPGVSVRVVRGDSISPTNINTRFNFKSRFWSTIEPFLILSGEFSFAIGDVGYFIDRGGRFESFDTKENKVTVMTNVPASEIIAAFSIKSKGYLLTASNPVQLWEFDPQGKTWTRKADYPRVSQFFVGFSFTIENKVYLGGGLDKTFISYDASTNAWSTLADCPMINRGGARAAVVNGVAYCFGGGAYPFIISPGAQVPNGMNWKYEPIQDKWTPIALVPDNIKDRSSGFIQSSEDKIYFGVGTTQDVGNPFSTAMYEYSVTSDTWRLHSFMPISVGITFSVFNVGNKTYGKMIGSGISGLYVFQSK